MQVAVTSVLSMTSLGAIVSAVDEDGRPVRVRTTETGMVVGDVLNVEGPEKDFSDQQGVHIQIEATHVGRGRTTGRLIVPWLSTLPGISRTRARRLVDAFGEHLLDVLRDRDMLGETAKVLDPYHPIAGAKLSRRMFVELASRDATEECRFRDHRAQYSEMMAITVPM